MTLSVPLARVQDDRKAVMLAAKATKGNYDTLQKLLQHNVDIDIAKEVVSHAVERVLKCVLNR